MTKFLRLGDLVVNEAAIANIYDTGDALLITMLSTQVDIPSSIDHGEGYLTASERIELCGKEAKAARAYFFSAAVSKKIY
ncbi:MAG: hypothetical protein AAGL08_13820 [Cyanobacteria bacterium J06573_11]